MFVLSTAQAKLFFLLRFMKQVAVGSVSSSPICFYGTLIDSFLHCTWTNCVRPRNRCLKLALGAPISHTISSFSSAGTTMALLYGWGTGDWGWWKKSQWGGVGGTGVLLAYSPLGPHLYIKKSVSWRAQERRCKRWSDVLTRQHLRLPWLGPAATFAQIFPRGTDTSYTSLWNGLSQSAMSVLSDK